jgi:hypothetical protein
MAMCRYLVADGRHCTEEAGDHDLCRWHDPAAAHNTPDTAEALERYVRQGACATACNWPAPSWRISTW